MSDEELRALDRKVAEKVMGWEWAVAECQHPLLNHGRCRKPDGSIIMDFTPTTSIAAAMEVLERVHTLRSPCMVTLVKYRDGSCRCDIESNRPGERLGADTWSGSGDTAPLAIVRAALAAVEASA